jgi:signal transduction histidine kinase
LIATNRGVVKYKAASVPPKLVATRVLSQRMHDLAELGSKIDLDYPQNSLLIEVAGQSSRTFPEEFQYAFSLRNARGETIDSRLSPDAQYAPSDLKPGDYTIETVAFNRDLLPSDPLVVRFSVAKAPFPWTATALAVLLAIAVVALIWAVVERRRIVLRSRELAAARLDLAHEAERERSRIARDLHDQTLADLRDLMMKSDKTLPPGTGFRDDIEAISTEIRRICEDLSPSVLENVGFIASLEFLLGHTVENYRFDAQGVDDEQIKFPVNVQLQIYRIAQEVLTNIKRHGEANLVEMALDVPTPGAFELTIVNDGRPFTPPEHAGRRGRGIAGIRSRAALIRASVEWDQTATGHPRFRLTLLG